MRYRFARAGGYLFGYLLVQLVLWALDVVTVALAVEPEGGAEPAP